jgi:hypothetical protein
MLIIVSSEHCSAGCQAFVRIKTIRAFVPEHERWIGVKVIKKTVARKKEQTE